MANGIIYIFNNFELIILQLKQQTESDPEPMSWGPFEHRYSTQKRMPQLVYTQLKNVAKKTILRVLAKHADSEEADQVRVTFFFPKISPNILTVP